MSDESPTAADPASSESPPAGRPKREGNESLWKRARRTLGTNQLTFLQPQDRPKGAAASAPGSGPAPPNKRREQVRQAQRTHRQRTQNYIKTLEAEVVRLRESEMKVSLERDKLQSQIDHLKSLLVSAQLPLPPDLVDHEDPTSAPAQSDFDFDMPATVSYATDSLQHERLHVQWPHHSSSQDNPVPLQHLHQQRQLPDFDQPYDFDTLPSQDLPNDFSLNPISISSDSPSQQQNRFQVAQSPAKQAKAQRASHVDSIETAIDFVLALEHPCMPHIPYPATPAGADPANHIMMLSAPLVAFSPQTPAPNMHWPASGAIIKELLNLSSSINLDGEITPVEAWHRLHQHPDFRWLELGDIETLKKELSPAVKCCGFGAVLDEDAFWFCLNRMVSTAKNRRRL